MDIPPAALNEQIQIYEEMEQIAKNILESLSRMKVPVESEVAKRTVKSILNAEEATDGVLPWLQKEFCRQVKLVWSDHMPISVSVIMPRQQEEP